MAQSKKAKADAKIASAAAGQKAAKADKPAASGKAAAKPKTEFVEIKTPVDRIAASAARAEASPCEAASGPKTKPRQCHGVGVVTRKVGKRNIKICAAHVLAKELRAFADVAPEAAATA